jgi:hypothetical protein
METFSPLTKKRGFMERTSSSYHIPAFLRPFSHEDSKFIEEKADYILKFIRDNGYRGDEMMMDPTTGEVKSAIDFARDIVNHFNEREMSEEERLMNEQDYERFLAHLEDLAFSSLLMVEKNMNGKWEVT